MYHPRSFLSATTESGILSWMRSFRRFRPKFEKFISFSGSLSAGICSTTLFLRFSVRTQKSAPYRRMIPVRRLFAIPGISGVPVKMPVSEFCKETDRKNAYAGFAPGASSNNCASVLIAEQISPLINLILNHQRTAAKSRKNNVNNLSSQILRCWG